MRIANFTATIANGQTESSTVQLGSFRLAGVFIPAAFTGVALTFRGSYDGTNFFPVHTAAGAALSVTVAAGRYVILNPDDFLGLRYIRFVSGSAEGALRTLQAAGAWGY